ncbi:hypothetical protein AB0E63_15990 [Kribbella sp. NPDC026596]|uniref:hypothetical protein n=1 Tax=Kribbella sp. NPDC026596 TaxID=3155122 RepID=UPI0033EA237D
MTVSTRIITVPADRPALYHGGAFATPPSEGVGGIVESKQTEMTVNHSRPAAEPHTLFWGMGSGTIAVGVFTIVRGVGRVLDSMELPNQFEGTGPEATADAASTVSWGAVILTVGAYLWRAGRRSGLRDRAGRVLIIAGYVLIGIAMSESIHLAVGIWAVTTDAQGDALTSTIIKTFLGWGVPGAILVKVGCSRRLANEEIIMTVEGRVS